MYALQGSENRPFRKACCRLWIIESFTVILEQAKLRLTEKHILLQQEPWCIYLPEHLTDIYLARNFQYFPDVILISTKKTAF